MSAAISPEGWVFIVCVLAAICTVAAAVLFAAGNATLARWRARRRIFDEVERFREDLDREDAVRVIGGGNLRASVEERRAA